MERTTWQAIATTVVGLTLLSLAGRAPAGFQATCCVCQCGGGDFTLCNGDATGNAACKQFCLDNTPTNATCTAQFVNSSSCGNVPACAASGPVRAPALDAGGLAAATALLAGLGALALTRVRRRR